MKYDLNNTQNGSYDLSTNILSEDEIRKMAPRVFCTEPTNPDVSKRYTLASTETVINDMKTLGWDVVEAKQPRRRKVSCIDSFHMVVFQNKDIKITRTTDDGNSVVDCYPRIILTNSHDGFNSFRFMVGLYRTINNNCLIVASNSFTSIRIRHINYTFDELRELVNQVINTIPLQIEIMNKMQNVVLTQEQKRELALAAIRERRNDDEFMVPDFMLDDLLEPTRPEDETDNLWMTFNILQEKVMKGGFDLPSKNGKVRKARQVKAIAKSIALNQAMFKKAVSFVE